MLVEHLCIRKALKSPDLRYSDLTLQVNKILGSWRLFQTFPDGPGVYSKPAFNRGPAFINEVFFLLPFYQVDLLSPNLRDPAKLVQTGQFSPSFNLTLTSSGSSPSYTPKHTAFVILYVTIKMW